MTHNLLKAPVFRPAVDALQKVWKELKSDTFDVGSMDSDERSAYYDLIDFCEAIVEKELPEGEI